VLSSLPCASSVTSSMLSGHLSNQQVSTVQVFFFYFEALLFCHFLLLLSVMKGLIVLCNCSLLKCACFAWENIMQFKYWELLFVPGLLIESLQTMHISHLSELCWIEVLTDWLWHTVKCVYIICTHCRRLSLDKYKFSRLILTAP
jgi:hypothetical protein